MVVHICKASSWKAEAGVSSKLRGSLIHKVSSTSCPLTFAMVHVCPHMYHAYSLVGVLFLRQCFSYVALGVLGLALYTRLSLNSQRLKVCTISLLDLCFSLWVLIKEKGGQAWWCTPLHL